MNATYKTVKSRTILIAACCLIVVGYFLMGGSDWGIQAHFNDSIDIFSTRRIVIAPTLCLAGYLLIIIGILRKK